MIGYLIRRLLQSIVVLILVTIITFSLIHLLPGSPAKAELGIKATAPQIAAFNKLNGFNKPVWYQYYTYMRHLFEGNLGFSYAQNAPVSQLFAQAFPKSMLLVGLAVVLQVIIAVPLGLYQAMRRNKISDHIFTGLSFLFYALPTFALGLILIYLFAIQFHFFPAEAPSSNSLGYIISNWRGLVLPVITLGLTGVAGYSRFMRSSVIDNLTQDYVRTAQAKGLGEYRTMLGHILRNSMLPMVTLLGLTLPVLLGGAIVTETIFNYPGVGLLFFKAAGDYDYPVLLGLTIVGAIAVIVGNLLADISYAILDPRIRY
jgi:peptide/nickel transport system permease protein